MKLNLKNPIVFFDLETTGTNINSDRIVEICYLKVYPNGNEETKTMRINPEMHFQFQPFRYSRSGGRIPACGCGYRHEPPQVCGCAGYLP